MKIDELILKNSHWQTGTIAHHSYPFKRKLFDKIQLDSRYAISISGLRRTGKSVLLSQLVEKYLTQNKQLDPKQVLLFSFDDDDSQDLLPNEELESLFDIYFKQIQNSHPQVIKKPILFALDEIQNVKNWQSIIKKYYDLNPHFKFILTGSSSLYIQENVESLAGRTIDYQLDCLDFQEYLEITSQKIDIKFIQNIAELNLVTPFFIPKAYQERFEEFLLIGGFPDTALMQAKNVSIPEIQRFIRDSIIKKIIHKDLRKYFKLENTSADARLYEVICRESGTFLELKNLASEVKLSVMTIKKHLEIFEKSSALGFLPRFDKKLRREISSTRKIYATSPCIMNAMIYNSTSSDSALMGHVAETYAYNQLRRLTEKLYVNKGRQNEEIDFSAPLEKMLIECKYSERLKYEDFSYLRRESEKSKQQALILSKSSFENLGRIKCVPVMVL